MLQPWYRPVTVLSHFTKVIETLIRQQFSRHVLPLLSPYQFAYKKNHSTETALLYMIESWKSAMDAQKRVSVISLDLTAAFDCIPHDLLLKKLEAYGMSPSSLKLMQSYLTSRYNCVRLHGKQSDRWFKVSKGIPQGSQWGPLIWNVYLNDLLPMIRSYGANVIAYADDVTVWICESSLNEVQSRLDVTIPAILRWFEEIGLQPNPKKVSISMYGTRS